ncbi:hypothetical protein TGFOU_236520A [Toxoplasma gondii FOU]|uniref:Uncharacterized protein n=1 Tax=Toxoplasma gondii FOU TaxID=943167 RepID=A0A086KI00_TOXGO|nr:hypothetical protein TGFOU_236520A [Toxoplasma gondii FOU]
MASGDVNIQTEKEVPPPLKSGIGEPKKTGYKFPHVFFPYKSRYRSPHRRKCRDSAEMRQGLRASVRRGGRELRDHFLSRLQPAAGDEKGGEKSISRVKESTQDVQRRSG